MNLAFTRWRYQHVTKLRRLTQVLCVYAAEYYRKPVLLSLKNMSMDNCDLWTERNWLFKEHLIVNMGPPDFSSYCLSEKTYSHFWDALDFTFGIAFGLYRYLGFVMNRDYLFIVFIKENCIFNGRGGELRRPNRKLQKEWLTGSRAHSRKNIFWNLKGYFNQSLV